MRTLDELVRAALEQRRRERLQQKVVSLDAAREDRQIESRLAARARERHQGQGKGRL